jgi:hypothetical protein
MKTVAPKKAEFCLLLKKEIESLNAIERYRIELKKEKLAKKELSIMEKVNSIQYISLSLKALYFGIYNISHLLQFVTHDLHEIMTSECSLQVHNI